MPKPKVKPQTDMLANIDAAAGTIGTKYSRGIDTGKPWQVNAGSEASETLFNTKMQGVLADKRRQKGVMSVSEEDWKRPAKERGSVSIGQNFRAAKQKWLTKTQPYLDVIANTEIADRTDSVDANIDGRLKPIANALHQKKVSG